MYHSGSISNGSYRLIADFPGSFVSKAYISCLRISNLHSVESTW